MPKVGTSQTVPFVLPHLTGRPEQFEVTPHEEVVAEIRLERFGGYLSSVDVHGEEVDVVVFGVERILNLQTVVHVVVDAAQHQAFRQGTEEQDLVRVRVGSCGYGIELAVDGTHRIIDRAFLQSLDVRHLYGRVLGIFLREQGAIDNTDPVLRIQTTSHEGERVLVSHQSYLDIDTVDQETILQEQVHV